MRGKGRLMRRGPKPAKSKGVKPSLARKSPHDNGDLDKQLAEARAQQAATAEILRLISSSPADAQPVFDAIAVNALRLCDAEGVVVARYDGALLHVAAHHNVNRETIDRLASQYPQALNRHVPLGRAILDGAVVHVPDLQAAVEFAGSVARQLGAGSHVAIPLLHRGRALGGIGISRRSRGPFSEAQIELLKTFADQAVIAIENVRLFNETKEALERQTATSEILRVISSSPTDVQPVFDAIAEASMRLCGAHSSLVTTFDGDLLHLVAQADISPEGREVVRDVYPRRPSRGFASGRSILTRAIVQIPDLMADVEFDVQVGAVVAKVRDFRSILAVPMLRDGLPIGTINAHKAQPGPFAEQQITLLQTFADQAVIA